MDGLLGVNHHIINILGSRHLASFALLINPQVLAVVVSTPRK